MVAVISVDAYPFLAFSVLTCCLENTFLAMWIFVRSLGVICCNRGVPSEGHKIYFKDWYLMNSQPTFLFLTYF